MFKDMLREFVEQTEGGVAGLIMGYDGIALEHYVREDANLDVETIGMEYSVILKNIQNAAEMLEAGTAREVSIQAERMTTVIRFLNAEYFCAVTLRPDGNAGKARYLLRVGAAKILSDLE